MNVEIGAEAALFPEKEYINGIFVAVWDTGEGSRQGASTAYGLPAAAAGIAALPAKHPSAGVQPTGSGEAPCTGPPGAGRPPPDRR